MFNNLTPTCGLRFSGLTRILLCLTLVGAVISCSQPEIEDGTGSSSAAAVDSAVKQGLDTVALLYPADFPRKWIRLRQPRDSDMPQFFYIFSSCGNNTGSVIFDGNLLIEDPGSRDLTTSELTEFSRSDSSTILITRLVHKHKVVLADTISIAALSEPDGAYRWEYSRSLFGEYQGKFAFYYTPDSLRGLFVEIQDTCSPFRIIAPLIQREFHRRKLREAAAGLQD